MKRYFIIAAALLAGSLEANAQLSFVRADTVHVSAGQQLLYPWAGGMNFCQFSDIDLNMDGLMDLFVFDRTGNRITTFINTGTANQVSYVHAPQYQSLFPQGLHDWVLLRDYNCDGKMDIFTYQSPGFRVFENTSTISGGLQFTLRYNLVLSNYGTQQSPNMVNLYVSSVDIPAIRDVDSDGDLDVLTFSILGSQIEYHQNMSVENGLSCQDTLPFMLSSYCWGEFSENTLNASISLNQSCRMANPALQDSATINHPPDQLLHSGSCLECVDVDGDSAKELLIGDISYNGITMVHNGGTRFAAHADSDDPTYPTGNTSAIMNLFPCGFHVDVDNDGQKDLLFSPNVTNAAENYHSVWYYHNTGTTDSTQSDFVQNDFLQDNMIEVGEGAYPVLYDYDGDGDKDLFVGDYGYYNGGTYNSKIALYKNIGTASAPAFTLQTLDFAYVFSSGSGLQNMAITFGDLDGDGDKDMLIGDYNGKLNYYQKQTGNPDNFTISQPAYQGIDVGNFATPQLIDIDRDGKLDLLIGKQNGFLSYYRNTGTSSSPVFTLITGTFGGVDVRAPFYSTGYSAPYMYDENGSYKLIVGSESGWLWKFDNIDGNLAGNFNLVDSMYMNLREGARTFPSGGDLNGDGLMDLAIGNYSGGVALFYGDNSVSTGAIVDKNEESFELYPNPANASVTVNIPQFSVQSKIRFTLYDMTGRVVLTQPITMQRTTFETGTLAAGIYTCAIENGGKRSFRKLVVNR